MRDTYVKVFWIPLNWKLSMVVMVRVATDQKLQDPKMRECAEGGMELLEMFSMGEAGGCSAQVVVGMNANQRYPF